MLQKAKTSLQGSGNSCSRSGNPLPTPQEHLSEFESELLDAIAKIEIGSLETTISSSEDED